MMPSSKSINKSRRWRPACKRPAHSLHFPAIIASILFLFLYQQQTSAQQLDRGDPCRSDFECSNFACALDSATETSSRTQRVCCLEDDYIFVDSPINANVCTFQPNGASCLDNRDELCASFVCVDGTCLPDQVEDGGQCDNDSDCINWSCAKERTESPCVNTGNFDCDEFDEKALADSVPSICCPSGESIDVGGPWGRVCTGQPNGRPCRGNDVLCGEEGSICQWNGRCEKPMGRYQEMELTAPTRFLSIKEFVKLQQTETDTEFRYREEREGEDRGEADRRRNAQRVWNDASQFELVRAIREERRWGTKFPFLLCVSSRPVRGEAPVQAPVSDAEAEAEADADIASIFKDEDGDTLPVSGYQKQSTLLGAVLQAEAESTATSDDKREGLVQDSGTARPESGSSASRDGPIEIGGVPITPLFNDDSLFCGHTMMYGSVAQKISCDGCIVQPLLQAMKMMPQTIAFAEQLMSAAIADYYDEGDEGLAAEAIPDRQIEDFPSVEVVSCAGVRSKEEFEGLKSKDKEGTGIVDTTESANAIISFSTGWGADIALRGIGENVYWAQEDAQSVEEYEEERGFAWWAVLNYTVAEKRCGDFFREKLIWRTAIGKDEKDFTYNRVYWNNTEVLEEDQYCILGLLVIIAVDSTVCHMEITPSKRVSNPTASWLTQTGLVNERPWTDLGLDGSGEVVAVSDTGIDIDNCYFWDANNEPGQDHRKIMSYNAYADGTDEEWGHGTHTSCTIAGKRATNGIEESTGAADGVAPGSKVAFLDIGSAQGTLKTPSDNEILNTGRPQAKIHSASWGAHSINYYSSQAKNFDQYMFDNDDFLVVLAAGNDGAGDAPTSVDVPANAKNVIAVGASNSYGSGLERGQLGPAHIAGFSSRGPTSDGRIKPDVVAPGKFVLSAGARPSIIGECDGSTIPAANGRSDGLLSMQGTSQATPVVSGTAALVNQYFAEGWHEGGEQNLASGISPSGALVKAVLMNGAQPIMKGVDNGPDGITAVSPYDNAQGFGIISLRHSLYIAGKTDVQIEFWDREVIDDGDTQTFSVTIDRSRGCSFPDFSATLVWFEKGAAMGCVKCVANDLDLYVTRDGDESQTRYYPNGLQQEDKINTIERVVINNVDDGDSFTLHVRATNLNEATQKFSLVSTGCFGGVANTLAAEDVFSLDNSTPAGGGGGGRSLSNTTIIAICVTIGVLVLLICGIFIIKRRGKGVGNDKDREDASYEQTHEDAYNQNYNGEEQYDDGYDNAYEDREDASYEQTHEDAYNQNYNGEEQYDDGYDNAYDQPGGYQDDGYNGYDEEEDMPPNYNSNQY